MITEFPSGFKELLVGGKVIEINLPWGLLFRHKLRLLVVFCRAKLPRTGLTTGAVCRIAHHRTL